MNEWNFEVTLLILDLAHCYFSHTIAECGASREIYSGVKGNHGGRGRDYIFAQ